VVDDEALAEEILGDVRAAVKELAWSGA